MRRAFPLLIALLLLLSAVTGHAEQAAADAFPDIRRATTIDEVYDYLIFPDGEDTPYVRDGMVRYITQDRIRDPLWHKPYWLGDEAGTELDLTLKESPTTGRDYAYHAGVMCTRAAFCMALSYLGVDMTPGSMSAITGTRNLNPPYQEIADLLNLERVRPKSNVFNTMMDNYLNGEGYSPVYLYIEKPDGQHHAVIVVAAIPDTTRFLVVDPDAIWANGEPHRVYMVALNTARTEIANSTFRGELIGSRVRQLYQWRLKDDGTE